MPQEPSGRPDAAIGWNALLVVDRHRCGRCEDCPADGTRVCKRLQDARITLITLDVPHPQH